MDTQTHISKLWSVLPNKLYSMPAPKKEDLQNLTQAGIKSIVCLLEDNSNIQNYNEAGFKSLWLPVADDKAPSLEQVKKLVEFIDEQNQINNPVAIHCQGGKGRTGTLIASYLIAKGASFEDAMNKIEANQPNAIKKEFQINFLKELSGK